MSFWNFSVAFSSVYSREEKQIFFRTQFLQILCQYRNLRRQLPVLEHMDSRERLFLEEQVSAFFRLIPDVLCQLIVLCECGTQCIQRSTQAFPTFAEIPQLIAEQQQIFTQIFHSLRKRREGVFN